MKYLGYGNFLDGDFRNFVVATRFEIIMFQIFTIPMLRLYCYSYFTAIILPVFCHYAHIILKFIKMLNVCLLQIYHCKKVMAISTNTYGYFS